MFFNLLLRQEMEMIDLPHLIISFLASTIFIGFVLMKWSLHSANSSKRRKLKLPPSPPKLPIVGHLHILGTFPHRSLHELSKCYGSLMLLHLGKRPVLVVSSASAACEVIKNHDRIFSNRPRSSLPDRLIYGSQDVIFAPYGDYWRQMRSVCVLHLLSNKRVQDFRRVREEETSLMVEKIIKQSSSPDISINMSNIFVSLTNDIVCRVALGRKYSGGKEGKEFKSLLSEFGELLSKFDVEELIPWLAWINHFNGLNVRVEKAAKRFDKFLEGVVHDHIKKREKNDGNTDVVVGPGEEGNEAAGTDFVDILLDIQRESKSTDFPIENDVIKALILDMFGAGTHTTYTTIDWAMTELLRNTQAMGKLQNEVRRVAGERSDITEDDIEQMHYLKAVIKESLRLHPPAPLLIPRESTQHCILLGYDIPAGTQVFINAWAIARDPSLWDNPGEFKPERFLESNIDFKGLNFELIPFGAGRRGCPGVTFATAVIGLALAKLVHKFNFALPDGQMGEDLDTTEASGLTVHRKFPLFVVATPC